MKTRANEYLLIERSTPIVSRFEVNRRVKKVNRRGQPPQIIWDPSSVDRLEKLAVVIKNTLIIN